LNFAKLIDDNIGSGTKQVGLTETRGQCDGEAWDFSRCRNSVEGVFDDPTVGRCHFHPRDRLLKDFRRRFRVQMELLSMATSKNEVIRRDAREHLRFCAVAEVATANRYFR
jgi:hypothetical protein